jgi:hypothetical protein
MKNHRIVIQGLLAVAWLAASSVAQPCPQGQWLPGAGMPGTSGTVRASTLWDPDGAGPRSPVIVMSGTFEFAGDTPAKSIATYDPATGEWSELGGGIGWTTSYIDSVYTLKTLPTGELVVGGSFADAGGFPFRNIAVWNGSQWRTFGEGLPGNGSAFVRKIETLPNGEIFACGQFGSLTGPGLPATSFARWTGTAWELFGRTGGILDIARLPNNDLLVCGTFDSIDGIPTKNVARWNGTSWTGFSVHPGGSVAFVSPYLNGQIAAIVALAPDLIYPFLWDYSLRIWDGTSWVSRGVFSGYISQYSHYSVSALHLQSDGSLVVLGDFNGVNGVAARGIARWNGTAWSSVGAPSSVVTYTNTRTITRLANNDQFVGGSFRAMGGVPARNAAVLRNGTSWHRLGQGFDGSISLMQVLPDGRLVACGSFQTAGRVDADRLAIWNGSEWSSLGTGSSSAILRSDWTAHDLLVLPGGDILVCGDFESAGGVPAPGIARWNGQSWSAMGDGAIVVHGIERLPDGTIVAAGGFTGSPSGLAFWTGETWRPVSAALPNGWGRVESRKLAVLPNGEVLLAGLFVLQNTNSGTYAVLKWNGSAWSILSSGFNGPIHCLIVMPDGAVIAGGRFTSVDGVPCSRIAQYDGHAWSSVGTGIGGPTYPEPVVDNLASLPDGSLIASGFFQIIGGVLSPNLARWNGSEWSAISPEINGGVSQVALLPSGELAVGGGFTRVGDQTSVSFARLTLGGLSPSLTEHPTNVAGCSHASAMFSVGAGGTDPLSYAWRKNSDPIDPAQNPSATTSLLHLENLHEADVGVYDCVVSNPCGSVTSRAAMLSLCPADLTDASGTGLCDRGVTIEDLVYFIESFFSGAEDADIDDGSGNGVPDRGVTIEDLIYFLIRFEGGC